MSSSASGRTSTGLATGAPALGEPPLHFGERVLGWDPGRRVVDPALELREELGGELELLGVLVRLDALEDLAREPRALACGELERALQEVAGRFGHGPDATSGP